MNPTETHRSRATWDSGTEIIDASCTRNSLGKVTCGNADMHAGDLIRYTLIETRGFGQSQVLKCAQNLDQISGSGVKIWI